MSNETNDPIAAAAAQLQTQDKPQGLVGELLDDVRELGEKIENFINPQEDAMGNRRVADAPETATDSSGSSSAEASTVGSMDAAATDVRGEDPNAGASVAESNSGADLGSSAELASQKPDTADRSVSASLVERARASIDHLRAHLWTFEHSAVAHLHKDLDFVESLFK